MAVASLIPAVERNRSQACRILEPKEMDTERSIGSVGVSTIDEASRNRLKDFSRKGSVSFGREITCGRVAFETALQINPGHALANVISKYQEDDGVEGKEYIDKAKRDERPTVLMRPSRNTMQVKRLYVREQTSELYKEATARSDDLKKKIKEQQ